MRRRYFGAVMATVCLALGAPAGASHLSIDFGPSGDGDDFGTDTTCAAGSSTPESCAMTLINNASSVEIPLGFTIDFGGAQPVSSLWTNENGIVTFTGPIVTSSFSSLAAVGQPVMAPFFADLTSVPFVGTVFNMSGQHFGQLMYQRGAATPLPSSDGTFDLTKEVPAFSMMWYGLTEGTGTTRIFTQVIIYSHPSSAPNDFDIRFLYGVADTDRYNTGTGPSGIAGLLLGSNTLNITGPLSATTDYFYSFRGGKLIGTTPPPPLTLTCPTATGQVGVAYSSALTAAGGVAPYTFSTTIGSPPAGLTLNSGTGALTGTPSTAGAVSFTAQVVDASGLSAGTVTTACTITVSPAASQLSVTPATVSFGTVKRFSLEVKTVTLKNTGASAVSLARPSITPGAGAGRYTFAQVSLCGRSLAAGKSCPIYVVLFGDVLGSPSATLHIPNNAAGSPQTVPLSATITH